MIRTSFLVLAVGVLVACNEPSKMGESGPDSGLALPRSARAKDSLIRAQDNLLAEQSRQLSLQSQLIGDAATSARLVSEIDHDLSKVRGLRVKGDTLKIEGAEPNASEQLVSVQQKVNALLARLNASEARVRRMRNDSTTNAALDSSQVAQLRDYEQSIGDLRSTLERQQQEITMLAQRVDSMTKVNTSLTAENTALTAHNDSVFVAIGTARELVSRGVARNEGGNKLLFGIGRTLVPARTSDKSAFEVMSKSRDVTIPLPKPNKAYRLVSRQSLAYLDPPNPKGGVVRGALRIADTAAFWAASKYLILVER